MRAGKENKKHIHAPIHVYTLLLHSIHCLAKTFRYLKILQRNLIHCSSTSIKCNKTLGKVQVVMPYSKVANHFKYLKNEKEEKGNSNYPFISTINNFTFSFRGFNIQFQNKQQFRTSESPWNCQFLFRAQLCHLFEKLSDPQFDNCYSRYYQVLILLFFFLLSYSFGFSFTLILLIFYTYDIYLSFLLIDFIQNLIYPQEESAATDSSSVIQFTHLQSSSSQISFNRQLIFTLQTCEEFNRTIQAASVLSVQSYQLMFVKSREIYL